MFSEQELAFLRTQPLARLATVAVHGQPDADAVGFAFENGRFYIGGYFLEHTRKYKHIAAGQSKVSLLVDELRSLDPLEPRSIKLHGEAEILQLEEGFRGPGTYIVIRSQIHFFASAKPTLDAENRIGKGTKGESRTTASSWPMLQEKHTYRRKISDEETRSRSLPEYQQRARARGTGIQGYFFLCSYEQRVPEENIANNSDC